SLVPRSRADALVESDDEAIAQVLQMVLTGTVKSVEGDVIKVQADSICLHGDGAHALAFAQRIRQELQQHNIAIKATE
ncbi:LamB/YcsF family protein, partial [Achromobacter xylosoxidans]